MGKLGSSIEPNQTGFCLQCGIKKSSLAQCLVEPSIVLSPLSEHVGIVRMMEMRLLLHGLSIGMKAAFRLAT